MPASFGARLRQRREEQQITLTAIAAQTKIGVSLLEGLERDDVSHWPGGIFRRAFVRAYAHAIRLDADVIVREFLELHPDPSEVVPTPPAAASNGDAGAVPPTRLQQLAGSAIGSLSGLGRRLVQSREPVVQEPAVACPAVKAAVAPEPDLLAAADLCTSFGRAGDASEAAPLLEETARILDAVGLIVWVPDLHGAHLRPALAHGYSDKVLAQLPRIGRDADNATAAAFRSAQMCSVDGGHAASGALVVPMMTPAGCAGVLAIELERGAEKKETVRALATIFAAQLATVIGRTRPLAVRRRA